MNNRSFSKSHRCPSLRRRPYSPSNGTIFAHVVCLSIALGFTLAAAAGWLDGMARAILR